MPAVARTNMARASVAAERALQIGAALYVVVTLPTMVRIVATGEMSVGGVRYMRGDLLPFACWILAACYLGWTLLMGRLEQY